MLAYKNRFHGYNSLRYVYKNGVATRSQQATIKTSQNPRRTTPRVAVVVSKKVIKSAVGRNRIRRRLYELFRTDLNRLKPDRDIVCIVSSAELRDLSSKELTVVVSGLLQNAGLYKE